MFLIAHRGNISGISSLENHPSYINDALHTGYDVEIDLWVLETGLWLGHDKPDYKINLEYLLSKKDNLWCHAKNREALFLLLENDLHCFWQQNDDYTVTSKGFIFTHSNILIPTSRSVLVSLDGSFNVNPDITAGICSDHIGKYRDV